MASISRIEIPLVPTSSKIDKVSTPPETRLGKSFAEILDESMNKIDNMWNQSHVKMQASINQVPKEYRAMLEAQILVSNCNLKVEMVTKAADASQSAVKRLQQQG